MAARALLLLAVLLPMPAFAQDTPNPIVTETIVSADRSATATIEANEDPSYTLDLTGGGTEPERDANLEFTVTLSASPPHQIAVEWATTDGSATAGSDYTAASDAITFAAAATGAALTDQFTVALLDDSVPEGDHQFTVSLRNPTGEGARIGTGTATVTIVDNDTPTLSIADASVDEGVAGGMITFPVTLSPAAATEVTVAYATADGSATTGVDYTAASGTLTFAPGGTSATISIAVTDDTEEENDETFTVTLSNPSSSATLGDATATGTIKANDARPPELSLRDARSSEGDGSVSFTVELDRSITDPVTATWSTADGTATAADYTAVSNGLLTIGAGSTSTQITVSVTDDTIDELNETFTVRVTSPANAELSANPLVATGTIEDDDLPTVTIAAVATTVIEGSPAVFTVSRTIADSSALAVSLDSSQTGTFASGALPTSVTIPTGATSQRLTVATDDDTVDETNGTLEVTVVANAEAYVVGTGTSASVTIEDDDQYRLSLTGGGTRTESNADVMFTVTIGGSPAEEATVDWRTADGTANSPSDYTGADATLTFAADTTTLSQQFTVSILDDDLDEPDEQFTVTLSNAKKAALGSSATATVKIEDDDVPTIDIKDVTADEDDAAGTIRFPVALSLPSTLAITVDYVTADDTATVTEDYVAARGTLTFPVGTTERTIAVALVDDGTDEPASESLTVTLSGPSATATLGEAVATGTIVDDEDPPMVSIRDATAEEGDASITFTVELSGPSSGDIGVTWSTQDGTATAPYDYTPVTGASVVIAAGELTATLTVTLNLEENQDDEPDKLFRVKLAAISSGSAELADTSADGVVADDDLPRVTITPGTDVTEGEDAGFTLQRVGVAEKPLTINLAVSQAGQVLKTPQALPETATFDAGSLQAGVAIATDDDDVDEANGSIAIAVQNGQAYNLGDPAAAAVTVRDNDLPIVSIASAPSEVTEGNDLPVGVTRAGDLTEALEVQLMFSATEGYSMEEPRVSGGFAAASSTATLTASVVGNTIDAPDGTVTVALVTQDRAYRAGSSSSTTVTVRDDDTAGVPSLFVSDTTCAEQTSVCNVHVFVSEGPKENFEAILYTENGTAIGGRTQGEEADFVAARITFFMYASNHGYGTYDIITILADDLDEHDETFIVRVELAEGTSPETATLGDVEAVVTIIDNNDPPTLAIADAAASEGAGSMRFSLSLSPASGRDVVVDWLASAGSATAPADYTETSGTVTIAAGDTSANLDVPLNDDFASEQSETFEVAISAVHATVTDELAIGRIEDNDRALTMTVSPAVIAEGESATVTVQTDGTPVATDQTITLALSGSAREGASNDYTVTPRSITIPANAASGSATIAALDDTRVEGDETILIDARRGDSPVGSAEITISDNDRSFGLTVTPAVIEEAEDVTVTVTVTTPGGDTFDTVQVVTLALSGTATEGMDDDYTLSSTSISIAVDATYGTAVVTVADDALVEGNETITITATHEGSRIGTSTITIEDDDEANFTLSVAPDTLNEGAATTATVTVAMPAGGGVAFDTDQTVILALSGSATEGADFTIVPDHITIPAGGTAGTAAITPLEDTVVEGAETITITATHGATRIGSTDVTIEDNDVAPLTMTIADAALNEGDTTTVTVATDGATFAADQTIVLELTGSTATATDDFVVTPQEITILANTMSGVASVAAVDDVQVEDSETIAITARHDGAVIGTGTITIADNDTANFGATVDPTTIAEGEGTAVVVETGGVSFPEDQLFAVDLSGTATAGEDYTVTPPTITVAAGSTSGSAAVTALDDTLVEEAETIDIVVSRDGTTIDTLEVTISASDQSSFGLTVDPATVVEGGSVSVTATTGGVTFTDEQIVSLRFTGSATDRTDFTISPTRITIPAGATSGQAIVTTIDDSLVEGDETITIAGSHGDDQIGSRNVTIADNDAASFALTVEPATIDEGATAVVTVAAAEGIDFDSDQIVTLALSGTATRGAEHDYTISSTGITIAAGDTSGTATVTTLEDDLIEGPETIAIAALHVGTEIATAIATIADGDAAGMTISVDPEAIAEGDAATATVTVTLDEGVSFPTAQTVELTLGGSATVDSDYTITPARITIPAAAAAGTAVVAAVDDTLVEGDETVSITASIGAITIGTVEVGIADNDDAGSTFTISVDPSTITEGETATVTVDTGGDAVAEARTISLDLGGSASRGGDYTIEPSSIEIAAGETAGTATITAVDDSDVEDAETITVTARDGAMRIGTGQITIRDNDSAGDTVSPTVAISSSAEFPANARFMVSIRFSEGVTGFAVEEIEVTNGAAAKLRGSGATYTVEVTPQADFEGSVTVAVAAGAAVDAAGNPNRGGSASYAVDTKAPTLQRTTLNRPIEEWVAPTDAGADTASGLVSFPSGDEAGSPDRGAGSPAGDGTGTRATGSRSTLTLTLTYDEPLEEASIPPPAAFTVRVAGRARAVVGITVQGTRVGLRMAAPVTSDQTVTVSYTAPSGVAATRIRDLAGNAAHDLGAVTASAGATAADRQRGYAHVSRAVLPYAAATLQAGTVAAIGRRVAAAGVAASWPHGVPMTESESLGARGGWQRVANRRLLSAADFVVPLGASPGGPPSAAASVALWGTGDYRNLSGGEGSAVTWRGDLTSFQAGGDLRALPELLAGVAVAWSEGRFEYTDRGSGAPVAAGVYETGLVSVHPYLGLSAPEAGLRFWISAGYGWGEVRIAENASAQQVAPTRLLSGAVGGSGRLLSTDTLVAGGRTMVRLQGDGSLVRMEVDESGSLGATRVDTRRLRVLLQGSHAQSFAGGRRLQPTIDIGLRYEDGDGPQGAGLELGGELRYLDPALGLTLQGHGRLLATHESAYEEWGAGGLLRLELGVGGRGLWLSVAPSWGKPIGTAPLLWERGVAPPVAGVRVAETGAAGRLDALAGYGLPAGAFGGLLTPYGGFTLGAAGDREYRGGVRLELDTLELSLEGTRREGTAGGVDHAVTLGGGLHY